MLKLLLVALSSFTGLSFAEPAPKVTPVLWSEPKPKSVADWIWGPGGEIRAPRPPFHFVKESLSGTNPKIEVTDAADVRWVVKFGGEVHSETFAARILDAAGYMATPVYFVPEGVVSGVHGLKRANPFVSRDGRFHAARFQLRDSRGPVLAKNQSWSWSENPFVGSHELNGLKILMMLLSNWDAKDARDGEGTNTGIFVQGDTRYYSFTDWGATLGCWGGFLTHSRWDLAAYRRQTHDFVKGVHNGAVVWGYRGKHHSDVIEGITIADVRWILPYLSAITDEQLRAGLIASGATALSADGFTRAIRARIMQLKKLAAAPEDTRYGG
jgi:hypothetical protein